MSSAMQRHEKNDLALEIHDHEHGEDIRLLRRVPHTDEWITESTLSEKEARDLHALLGDLFLSE